MIKYILGLAIILSLTSCSDKSVNNGGIITEGNWLEESEFYCDKVTGVEYIFLKVGYGGGLTPRYNLDGTIKSCGSNK